jgi:GPH family glycoside/pentoside/hexuronide:cation symporter
VTYLLFFYVDHLGLPPALGGISVAVYALLGPTTNMLAGYLSDRTKTRWGRRRPYIMFGIPPLFLLFVLIWSPPYPASGNTVWVFVYFLLIICLFEAVYNFVVLNLTALFPEMFRGVRERSEVSFYRQVFTLLGLLLGIAVPPLLYDSIGWSGMGLVIGGIGLITMLVALTGIKEGSGPRPSTLPLRGSITGVLRNRMFIAYGMATAALYFSYDLLTSGVPFYTKYVLGVGALETHTFLLVCFLTVPLFMGLWAKVVPALGPKRSYCVSLAVFGLFSLALLFGTREWMFPLAALVGAGLSGTLIMPDIVLGEIIDEDERVNGVRREGIYYGVNGLVIAAAVVLQGATIGSVLSLTGYVPDAAVQVQSAVAGIRFMMGLAPLLALLAGAMAMWRLYRKS